MSLETPSETELVAERSPDERALEQIIDQFAKPLCLAGCTRAAARID